MVWRTQITTLVAESHDVVIAATGLFAEQDSTSGGGTLGETDAKGDRQVGTTRRRVVEMYFGVTNTSCWLGHSF